jgi:hypothetical protein
MQRNFNADKMNNKNFLLRFSLSAIHNLFFMINRKPLKSGVVSSSSSKKLVKKPHNLFHPLTKQVQTSKLPSITGKKAVDSGTTQRGESKNCKAPVLNMTSIGKCRHKESLGKKYGF